MYQSPVSGDVGRSCFFGITWTDEKKIGHSSPKGSNSDGLMCRSVFANTDAVVGDDVNLLEALESGHTDGGSGIQVEDEVGTCHRNKSSLVESRKPIGGGAHGMLANTVVDIAATVVSVKAARSSEFGLNCISVMDFEARKGD